jgi:hypothetical protein
MPSLSRLRIADSRLLAFAAVSAVQYRKARS